MENLRRLGIYITGNRCANFFPCASKNAASDLENVLKWHNRFRPTSGQKRLFIVVVDDESNNDLYKTIKQKFDKNGIINQVVKVGVLRNIKVFTYRTDSASKNEDFSFNLALSINSKLGGTNCLPTDDPFDLWTKEVNSNELIMFIGIDTKLSAQKKKLGVVAISASINNNGTRFNNFAMMTNGFQKYCSDYKNALFYALDAYEGADKNRSRFPRKIVIFRAGMNDYELTKGEGFLERSHIKSVIDQYMFEKRLQQKPLITYIGYNRSNGVRFYVKNMESRVRALTSNTDPEGAKLNVPPGTVIDNEITNPNCFYFISHKTLMGTTKVAKYTIVDDEIRFKADNLLAVVYQLCRLMPQTKRSYRRPIPIGLTEKVLKWCTLVEPDIYDERRQNESINIHPDFVNCLYFI
uniref:Piwi domain-containing protein n=1 Tax=Panagrolaimus davidi TaxID=227884 RepID=A0A914P7M2_9BILA